MSKKIIIIIIVVLLLSAGIIAVTQEAPPETGTISSEDTDDFFQDDEVEIISDYFFNFDYTGKIPEWASRTVWYRSNKGGMALEEMRSQIAALRNEYALCVTYTQTGAVHEEILPHLSRDYFLEMRVLYENGEHIRTQWIFRDENRITRVSAVIQEEEHLKGFIEVSDENEYLIAEYMYYDDGKKTKTGYAYNDNLLITAENFLWEDDDKGGDYYPSYTDYYRYNRSLFLRAIERIFHSGDPVRISFPGRIMDAAKEGHIITERLQSYPEYFGVFIFSDNDKIVYATDDRGRVLTETLYNAADKVVWVISNTWLNDRVVSTLKTQDGEALLAEYEYDADGNRITERNSRNGILERIVRTRGKTDIEELYINNVMVLTAVWEDGRKISETRTANR